MLKFFKTKRRVAAILSLVVLAGGAVAAYAFFVSGGAGTGKGSTATPSTLIIQPIGAGYDSLIPLTDGGAVGGYIQDQCLNNCTSVTSIGNQVNLANVTDTQRLVSFVVAFRNRGGAINTTAGNQVPITVTVGGHSVTQYPAIAAGNSTTGRPTVTEATFDFSATPAFIASPLTYEIQYDGSIPAANSLNVALSNSANDITAGADTGNSLWLSNSSSLAGGENDFPTCVGAGPGAFGAFDTTCGHNNPVSPYAYGTVNTTTTADHVNDVANGNANIPAVEINVLGGVVPDLSPGVTMPVNFAIQNPGTTSVGVTSVSTSIAGINGGAAGCTAAATAGNWYTLPTSTVGSVGSPIGTVPPGITVFAHSGLTVKMVDSGTDQSACIGATVHLNFLSN